MCIFVQQTALVHQFYLYICHTKGQAILFALLYGYKALLQVIALILAFHTRKVKVKGLDDSKYIAAAIYVTSIVLAIVIISTYTLRDYVNTFPMLVGLGILVGNTVILTLVFVPRVSAEKVMVDTMQLILSCEMYSNEHSNCIKLSTFILPLLSISCVSCITLSIKMMGLYKDPQGKRVFSTSMQTEKQISYAGDSDSSEKLQQRIEELEAALNKVRMR